MQQILFPGTVRFRAFRNQHGYPYVMTALKLTNTLSLRKEDKFILTQITTIGTVPSDVYFENIGSTIPYNSPIDLLSSLLVNRNYSSSFFKKLNELVGKKTKGVYELNYAQLLCMSEEEAKELIGIEKENQIDLDVWRLHFVPSVHTESILTNTLPNDNGQNHGGIDIV